MATAFFFAEGTKVLPHGPHWRWPEWQCKGAVYGVMIKMHPSQADENDWVAVQWIDYKGNKSRLFAYRLGPDLYDLKLYEE